MWKQVLLELFLLLVVRKDMGTDSSGVVGGFSAAGLNINNNNLDNENNGIGSLRNFCDDFPH